MTDWTLTDQDREVFEQDLASFVPDVIFDAHVHWYATEHFEPAGLSPFLKAGPAVAGAEAFSEAMAGLLPGRQVDGLCFPFPNVHVNTQAANEFLAEQLTLRPGCRGQMLITPEMDPEFIREACRRYHFVGLKCYHVYSAVRPTWDSRIEDFLPEAQVQVAHEAGLAITLHIVRPRALADQANQETLRRYCSRYPRMKMILAHAARGFNPHHTLRGIDALRGLDNVWFDTSAITDSGAFEAIIRTLGHDRLLYGADYPVSHLRGRCIGLGDSFFWIHPDTAQLQVPYADLQPSLVGMESLRTLKLAAYALNLSDTQVEDIFRNNALRMLGMG